MDQEEINTREIKPITMPGVHSRAYKYLSGFMKDKDLKKVLDVGAGHGAFSKQLYEDGFQVSACDLHPDNFYFDRVECRQADITKQLPYEDSHFDIVVLIEVMEHIHDHVTLFRECNRVLKKDGILFFSTPNILSLKSRIRFLLTGFFSAFKPLNHQGIEGRQHVAALTVDQFTFLSQRAGFSTVDISIDKKQKSSLWWSGLIPMIWFWCFIKGIPFQLHNRNQYLMGRLLFFKITK